MSADETEDEGERELRGEGEGRRHGKKAGYLVYAFRGARLPLRETLKFSSPERNNNLFR